MIDTHNGFNEVPAIDVNDYPGIKNHLKGFWDQLKVRQDQGQTPYNLRSCAYHDKFLLEKLFWSDLSTEGRFSYSPAGHAEYCVNSVYFLSGEKTKLLAAFLNSKLITWYVNKIAGTAGFGVARWFANTVEGIPIPRYFAELLEIENLVQKLLDAYLHNNISGACGLGTQIDIAVNQTYGLTAHEVDTISQ